MTDAEKREAEELANLLWMVDGGGPTAQKILRALADDDLGHLLSAVAEGKAVMARGAK